MIVIGELINATRKKVGAAVEKRDADFIRDLARRQAEAGADLLDVNGGVPGREAESLEWLIQVVQEVTELPLAIDSSDPAVVRRAIPLCKAAAAVEFDPGYAGELRRVAAVVREHGPKAIALCMSSAGTPSGVDDRLETASRLVERLTARESRWRISSWIRACCLSARVRSTARPSWRPSVASRSGFPGYTRASG